MRLILFIFWFLLGSIGLAIVATVLLTFYVMFWMTKEIGLPPPVAFASSVMGTYYLVKVAVLSKNNNEKDVSKV